MEFKSFKPHLKMSALICSIVVTILLIVGLSVFGSRAGAHVSDTEKQLHNREIGRLILVLCNAVLVVAYVWGTNMSATFTGMFYVITTKKYVTKESKTTITKFTNPWWLHLLTAGLLVIIYFLSITGMMLTVKDSSWTEAVKENWWVALINFVVSFAILEFNYNYVLYSLNHDQNIISRI